MHSEDTHISDLCRTLKIPTNISTMATELWTKLRLDDPEDFEVSVGIIALLPTETAFKYFKNNSWPGLVSIPFFQFNFFSNPI